MGAGAGTGAGGADRDGLGRVRLVVDVDLIVDRNAAVAYAVCVRHGIFGVVVEAATATGSAKREPGEVFDADVARGLAVGRALLELGGVLASQAALKVEAQNHSRMEEWLGKQEQRRERRERARDSQVAAQERKQMFRDVIMEQAEVQGKAEGKAEISIRDLEAQLVDWFDYKRGCWKPGTEDFLKAWKVVP